jgi:hypothetical protein
MQAGFVVYPAVTRVYSGSTLETCLKTDFPDTLYEADTFIGSKSILQASKDTDADMTWNFIQEVAKQDAWTDLATRRIQDYMLFPMRAFLDEHPGFTGENGICVLNENTING